MLALACSSVPPSTGPVPGLIVMLMVFLPGVVGAVVVRRAG
jgi:hypothetical protein